MDLRFFEIYRNPEYLGLLVEGAFVSFALTLVAGLIGFGLASILASLRHYAVPVLAHLATAYVEFIRNTPLIVQLFFFAFGLPALLGYQWPFWAHALLALSINFSAYFSEIIRSGLQSVGDGQIGFANEVPYGLMVRADSEQLYRVLSNLMRNARQALESAHKPGEIRVEAGESERDWWIRVSDTGPGLPLKAQENLFTPFQGGLNRATGCE